MPDLNIQVECAEVVPYAATPMLAFRLRIENARAKEVVHTASLRCQIQIEATRRRYSSEEQARLLDLFGEPERWSQTLRTMLWTHADVVVPQFTGVTSVNLRVPCTFDFNVAATKYFHGLTEGDLPLEFLFSGMVFYGDENGALQVSPISWEKEAKFRLPLKIWRELIDSYYPNTAWLCLRRDVFERLYQYKLQHGIPTWEDAMESVLAAAEESVKP
jgi:Family of unknown function (DUF6084)